METDGGSSLDLPGAAGMVGDTYPSRGTAPWFDLRFPPDSVEVREIWGGPRHRGRLRKRALLASLGSRGGAPMRTTLVVLTLLALGACSSAPTPAPSPAAPVEPVARTVSAPDGVAIAYTARGAGDVALVFVHGGYADSSVWRHQVEALSDRYRVVTVDLAGHGASGRDRASWTPGAFGEDVATVVDAEGLDRVVLVGSSMGGPVALEAAARLEGRVLGVVAVDTLHDLDAAQDPAQWKGRLDALRQDFAGACPAMVKGLFREGADPALVTEVTDLMCAFPAELAAPILEGFTGYDLAAAVRASGVPLRAVNGDHYPTDVEGNRAAEPTFDAVVMPGMGHYPMLERPDEFNRALVRMVEQLIATASS